MIIIESIDFNQIIDDKKAEIQAVVDNLKLLKMNDDGTSEKAFLLPQAESEYYDLFDRSYNVPEFMIEPVSIAPHEFLEVVKGVAVNVKYSSAIR